jgi:hypothetical protein
MTDNLDCFVLMLGDENQVAAMYSAISSEARVRVSGGWRQRVEVCGDAWPWRDSAMYSCALVLGTPNRVSKDKPALMKWISILMLNPKTIRKKGSEAIGAATAAPVECGE